MSSSASTSREPKGGADLHWPRRFTDGQPCHVATHNTPYIQRLRNDWKLVDNGEPEQEGPRDAETQTGRGDTDAEGPEEESITDTEPEEETSIAQIVLGESLYHTPLGEPERHKVWAERIESFCGSIALEDMEKAAVQDTSLLAILIEQSRTGEFRGSPCGINEGQMYRALQAKRFIEPEEPRLVGPGDNETQRSSKAQPNADTRRLYIHNITPVAAAALMATASMHEIAAVRSLLHLHLSSDAAVRATIPHAGFLTFAFHLSLPYYVIRRKTHFTDVRRFSNGEALRSCHETVYGIDKLQEAQTTITVTGIDVKTYTAIALIDSTSRIDSVQRHHPDAECLTDPIIGDQKSVWEMAKVVDTKFMIDARVYFLWACKARFDSVADEWETIVDCVRRTVARMRSDDDAILSRRNHLPSDNGKQLGDRILFRARLDPQLRGLRETLFRTVNAWKHFQEGDIKYFKDPTCSRRSETLHAIENTLDAIQRIYLGLKTRLEELDGYMQDITADHLNNVLAAEGSQKGQALSQMTLAEARGNVQVSEEMRQLLSKQEKMTTSSRGLTIIGMIYLPLVLAFNLFSVSPAALPFSTSSPALAGAVMIFISTTLLLVRFLDNILAWFSRGKRPQPPGDLERSPGNRAIDSG